MECLPDLRLPRTAKGGGRKAVPVVKLWSLGVHGVGVADLLGCRHVIAADLDLIADDPGFGPMPDIVVAAE